jgi:hypothetical protein
MVAMRVRNQRGSEDQVEVLKLVDQCKKSGGFLVSKE